jgi:uncharacterized membrane protein YfcA
MDGIAIVSGLCVGVIVGMTGVGGGSLMTPLLLSVFRLSPAVAIGTDLWFAALTKIAGSASHHRAGQVNWRIAGWLLAGSIPASLATVAMMHVSGVTKAWASALTLALGIALLLTAVTVAYRRVWQAVGLRLERWITERRRTGLTVACGLILGVLVSLSSIGAGAIGATLILLLYPGIGHATLGHVDWGLLGALLVGSVPGIWLGAQLTRTMPEPLVRALLCVALVGAGLKVTF